MECTVLSRSNRDIVEFQEIMDAWRRGERTGRVRRSSPYHLPRQVFGKVYDKLARDLDPLCCQFPDDKPCVLALALDRLGLREGVSWGAKGPTFPPFLYWALEKLTIVQPRGTKWSLEGVADTTLEGWMDWWANELEKQARLSGDDYCEHQQALLQAPKKLSAYLLFGQDGLLDSRLNYNATHRLTHVQMADIEGLFQGRRRY